LEKSFFSFIFYCEGEPGLTKVDGSQKMSLIEEYIESGVLEMYVMGILNPRECMEVHQMAFEHPEVKSEIEQIEHTLKTYSEKETSPLHPVFKPFLIAMIDYAERLKNGEVQVFPPELNESSKIEDYSEWLNRKDMTLPDDFDQMYARIIGHTPKITSAIVWINYSVPHEIHNDECEKFLIVEGTCDVIIGEKIYSLIPGDYLTIPLFEEHHIIVTSSFSCKLILQRVAA
jgi:mannose-6-phosphate isomerase-like protein (cupin superfamily)